MKWNVANQPATRNRSTSEPQRGRKRDVNLISDCTDVERNVNGALADIQRNLRYKSMNLTLNGRAVNICEVPDNADPHK